MPIQQITVGTMFREARLVVMMIMIIKSTIFRLDCVTL